MAKNNEYRALVGIDYPPNKRVEAGAIVSDLPKESIAWLLASNSITADLKEPEVVVEPTPEYVAPEITIVAKPATETVIVEVPVEVPVGESAPTVEELESVVEAVVEALSNDEPVE